MIRPIHQPMQGKSARGGFTGWHMLAAMGSFFAVIIAVNLFMASRALGSFSGTVVANSYVASQHYNDWLAEGRRQQAIGWRISLQRAPDGHVTVDARDRSGAALAALSIVARADHPLGQADTIAMRFSADGNGWRSIEPLPPGRWTVRLRASRGDAHVDVAEDLS